MNKIKLNFITFFAVRFSSDFHLRLNLVLMMNFFGTTRKIVFQTSPQDPFNPEVFPAEIVDFICRYLTVQDLLEATLVSKLWNETIGSSTKFRNRVAIKLHSWNEEPPSAISNSKRSYEILNLSDHKVNSTKVLSLRDKNWRKLTLSIGKISSQKSFLKLMEMFVTVKDLKILSTNIRELNTNKKLVLPYLENLVFSDITLDLFDIFIANHPSLKSLSLRYVSCDILSPRRVGEAVVEFLSLNQHIKDLELNHLVTNDLFLVNIALKLNLELKALTVGLEDTTKIIRENLEEFLRSQSEHLERLKLVLHSKFIKKGPHEWGYWHDDRNDQRSSDDVLMIYNTWNSMTALKSLSIRFLQNSSDLEVNREFMKTLKRSTSITELSIQFSNVSYPPTLIMDLMKLSPNLKTIYVTKLTAAIVRYAAINLTGLREIQCFSFDGECQQELNELKTSRTDVNKLLFINDRCAFG